MRNPLRSLRRLSLWLLSAGLLGGCVRLGPYRAVAYDVYRPRVSGERVAIHTETALPVQWITIPETGRVVQGIPVVLELSADSLESSADHLESSAEQRDTLKWEDLATAFTIYEIRRLGEGRVERVDTFNVVLLPYERAGSARLSNHIGVLSAPNVSASRALSMPLLKRLPGPGVDQTQTFFLACVSEPHASPCVRFDRRYELVIASPTREQPPVALAPFLPQRFPAVYPFRMERRSAPVTIGAGVLLVVGFLTWAAG